MIKNTRVKNVIAKYGLHSEPRISPDILPEGFRRTWS